MKKVEAIIRTSKFEDVKEALEQDRYECRILYSDQNGRRGSRGIVI